MIRLFFQLQHSFHEDRIQS
nr:translational initiation factor 1 [Tropaeolum majus]UVF30727.1 translational initiation factor 1 [Tropaeolum majus]UVF31913.1 translational initiation factor 1 [Tropaeolum majus]UVF36791.1 translational initiation factor 1 [Tropaeolum majus]